MDDIDDLLEKVQTPNSENALFLVRWLHAGYQGSNRRTVVVIDLGVKKLARWENVKMDIGSYAKKRGAMSDVCMDFFHTLKRWGSVGILFSGSSGEREDKCGPCTMKSFWN